MDIFGKKKTPSSEELQDNTSSPGETEMELVKLSETLGVSVEELREISILETPTNSEFEPNQLLSLDSLGLTSVKEKEIVGEEFLPKGGLPETTVVTENGDTIYHPKENFDNSMTLASPILDGNGAEIPFGRGLARNRPNPASENHFNPDSTGLTKGHGSIASAASERALPIFSSEPNTQSIIPSSGSENNGLLGFFARGRLHSREVNGAFDDLIWKSSIFKPKLQKRKEAIESSENPHLPQAESGISTIVHTDGFVEETVTADTEDIKLKHIDTVDEQARNTTTSKFLPLGLPVVATIVKKFGEVIRLGRRQDSSDITDQEQLSGAPTDFLKVHLEPDHLAHLEQTEANLPSGRATEGVIAGGNSDELIYMKRSQAFEDDYYEPSLNGAGLLNPMDMVNPKFDQVKKQEANLPSGEPVKPVIVGDSLAEMRVMHSYMKEVQLRREQLSNARNSETISLKDNEHVTEHLPSGLTVKATIVQEDGSIETLNSAREKGEEEESLQSNTKNQLPSFQE